MVFVGISLIADGAQNLFNAFYTIKSMGRTPRESHIRLDGDGFREEL